MRRLVGVLSEFVRALRDASPMLFVADVGLIGLLAVVALVGLIVLLSRVL